MFRKKWNMPSSKSLSCIASTFLVFAGALAAQSTASWNIVKALASGAQVRITAESRTVSGQFQTASDESVVLTSTKGQETFTRSQVTQVAVKKASKRRRNALIGLAAGAGLGLATGSIADSKCAGLGCFISPNLGKEALTPTGAILGLGVGWAWPSGGWRSVYKQ